MRGRAFVLLGLVLAACFPGVSSAGSFRFAPTNVEIPAAQRASTVTLFNTDTVPLNFQIRIFKWSQVGGKDVLEPADDLMVVSPPAITIQPGVSFQLRIARRGSGPVGQEQAYRLVIDQLDLPSSDGVGQLGIAMMYRASLPVYVTDAKAEANLEWRVWQDADGLHAGVSNNGTRRLRLNHVVLQPEDGPALSFDNVLEGSAGAALAGSAKEFAFKPAEGQSMPRLRAGSQVSITVNAATEQPLTYVVNVE